MRPQLSGISEHVIEWNLKSDTKKISSAKAGRDQLTLQCLSLKYSVYTSLGLALDILTLVQLKKGSIT